MLVTFFSSMCNFQAGGQAAKHSPELVKCFAFIYKTLNHMTDLNKLNKSQRWRKVYEACRPVNMGTGPLHLAFSSVPTMERGPSDPPVSGHGWLCEERNYPHLFPPAAELLDILLFKKCIKIIGVTG